MLLSGCGLFGGDDASTDVTSTAEEFEPEPTANVVQAVPVDGTDGTDAAAAPTAVAAAPLPTAVTIPSSDDETAAAPVDRTQPSSYVVQSGDVLGLIAERFGVDIAELRRVNDLSGNLIRVGQTLTIPADDGSTTSTDVLADETDETDETASTPAGSTTPSTPSPTPTPVSCGANAVGHCVQSGDSLLGIASKYGTTVDALRSSNPSIVGDTIRIGDLLTIPGQTTSTTTTGGTTTGTTTGGTTTTEPTAIPAPQSDADCAARNIEFPYFHAADGLCYANPIGGGGDTSGGGDTLNTGSTDVSTEGARFVTVAIPSGQVCPDSAPYYGQFERDNSIVDGPACYPAIAVIEPTPTPGPTSTPSVITIDYGDGPDCDDWEVVIPATNKCWPGENATDAQVEAGRVKADS